MRCLNFILIGVCLAASSCARAPLSVNTEYWGRQDLASYIIDTPDPAKTEGAFGQRLYIDWNVSQKEYKNTPLFLDITVRLKDGSEQKQQVPLTATTGSYIYSIVGSDFSEKGGLLSYLIELKSNEHVIATSRHKFWVEELKITD